MSIYQALQLSYASPKFGGSYFDRPLGSDQIVGRHSIPALRREQAALRAQQAPELTFNLSPNSSPFTFAGLIRQLARIAALLGR